MKKMLCFYFVLALNQPALFCMRKQISPRAQNDLKKPERKIGRPKLLQKLSPRNSPEQSRIGCTKMTISPRAREGRALLYARTGEKNSPSTVKKVVVAQASQEDMQELASRKLMNAISSQNIPEIERMLEGNVDINYRTPEGSTALMTAIFTGNAEVVEILIKRGADVRPSNSSPMQLAEYIGNEKILDILNRAPHSDDEIQGLIDAIDQGNIEKIDTLLSRSLDVNRPTRDGKTALIAAIFSGNKNLVKLLIQKGADTNPKTTNPLQVAYLTRNEKIINLLQKHGAIDEAHSTIDNAPLRKKKAHSCDCEKCADALAKEIEGYASQRVPLLSIDMGLAPEQVKMIKKRQEEILKFSKLEASERRAEEAAIKRRERSFELTIGVDSPPQPHPVMPCGTIDDAGREPVNIFDIMMKQKMK